MIGADFLAYFDDVYQYFLGVLVLDQDFPIYFFSIYVWAVEIQIS